MCGLLMEIMSCKIVLVKCFCIAFTVSFLAMLLSAYRLCFCFCKIYAFTPEKKSHGDVYIFCGTRITRLYINP